MREERERDLGKVEVNYILHCVATWKRTAHIEELYYSPAATVNSTTFVTVELSVVYSLLRNRVTTSHLHFFKYNRSTSHSER